MEPPVPALVRRRRPWTHWATATLLLTALVSGLPGAGRGAAADVVPVTYAGPTYTAGASPSADKPQSKLWWTAGTWWALMRTNGNKVNIHELMPDQTWRDTGTLVDDRGPSTGDALWENGKLVVASRTSSGTIRVYRFTFDSGARRYARDSGFPVTVAGGGSESVTIDRDGAGRLWLTYTQSSRVMMAHSTTSDTAWTAPRTVPVSDTAVSSDDLSAVIALPGKVGIMWSDQASNAFRFAVHDDSAPDTTWTMETPLAGSNLADDHINLKSLLADDAGRVHAAVKTSQGDDGEPGTSPSIMVLSRASNGTWTSAVAGRVQDSMTRAQLAIDSSSKTLYLLATAPESGGVIYYKRTPLSTISFGSGRGQPFVSWSGAKINNVTLSKQPVNPTTRLVALASDTSRYYHAELPLGEVTPPPPPPADTTRPSSPTGLQATGVGSTSVQLSWQAATDDVGVTGYDVNRDGQVVATPSGTTATDSGLAPATSYTYTVVARDAAGNRSAPSAALTVTTQSDTSPPPASGSPTFRGASSAANNTSTTLSVSRPAGTTAGDVLLASVSVRGAPTIAPQAGWTLVRLDVNSTVLRQALYVRVAAAGDPGGWTWTFNAAKAAVGEIVAYGGVDSGAPVAAHAGQVNASSTTVTAPSVQASAGQGVVALFSIARSTTMTTAQPLTERAEVRTTAGTYHVTGVAADTLATTTGSVGAFTSTAPSGAVGVGQTVVLRPAG
jgi:chitodextrinase